MKMNDVIIDELCRKLRLTVAEFGEESVKNVVMVGHHKFKTVSGILYINCPTMGHETLGNVDYKTARFYEDA